MGSNRLTRCARYTMVTTACVAGILLSLGGCPVQQVPRTPPADENDNASNTAGSGFPTNTPTEQTPRPIPSIPVDVPDDNSDADSDLPSLDTPLEFPISIVITSGNDGPINILPGAEQSISYEVFGGRPEDGVIRVALIYDVDGVDNSGDEVVLQNGLPVRGTVDYTTAGIPSGTYFVGIRAANDAVRNSRFAPSKLEIVGAATATLTRPSVDLEVRPSATIDVRGSIETLARNVGWTVFTDQDGVFNGNEVDAFSGGGRVINGAIFPQNLANGDHFIGIEIRDSLGQSFVQYFSDGTGTCTNGVACRKFTIDEPPTIIVTAPTDTVIAQPGDEIIRIEATVADIEGDAEVSIFRDADGTLNDNEFELASFTLQGNNGNFSFDFDTSNLFPGTYRFGVKADDGNGAIAGYATGTLIIPLPPSVSGSVLLPNDMPVGARTFDRVNDALVSFAISDPNRRLRLQPQGIVVNVYVDEDTDGVPDTATPAVTLTDGLFSIPFSTGLNFFELDLEALNVDAGADGLANVLVEILLSEVIGNEIKVDPIAVFELDTIRPDIDLALPNPGGQMTFNDATDILTIAYSLLDNNASTVKFVLADAFTGVTFDVPDQEEFLQPNDQIVRNLALWRITPDIPTGLYNIAFEVRDNTNEITIITFGSPEIAIMRP